MQREFELLHCWDQRWATATVVYRISYISHVFKGIAKYYTEKYCNILQISHVLGYIETATEKMQLLKGGWDDQCFEDIVWNYMALLPEDWSLIVVCKEYGPDHRKRLIQTVFWSIAAKVALPYLDQHQTMISPPLLCCDKYGRVFGISVSLAVIIFFALTQKKHHEEERGRKNPHAINIQVKVRYNIVWRH